MSENSEIYTRLRQLEQDTYNLKYRMDAIEEDNLGNRVLSLEGLVNQMTKDAARMESTAEEIKETVIQMKSWGVGFVACLSAIVVVLGVMPYLEVLFK